MTKDRTASNTLHPDRLNSWKEIAAYLERDERTAKRWEKARALPIRRLPGGRGRVFAFISEIDHWQRNAGSLPDLAAEMSAVPALEPAAAASFTSEATLDQLVSAKSTGFPERSRRLWVWPAAFAAAAAVLLMFMLLSHRHTQMIAAASRHVPPAEAQDLYLSGRFYWNTRTAAGLQTALADFQKAVTIDPQYAAAYAGIADCYALMPSFAGMPASTAFPKMLEAAQRAVAIDPDLPEGHRALGFVLFYWNWDREESRREFERSIALNDHDATTLHWYANVLMQSQRSDEALPLIDRARMLDPTSPALVANRALLLAGMGRTNEAMAIWSNIEKTNPLFLPPHRYRSNFALDSRDVATFLAERKEIAAITGSAEDAKRARHFAEAYEQGGEVAMLRAVGDAYATAAQAGQTDEVEAAHVLHTLHRDAEALELLHRAYEHRNIEFPLVADTVYFADWHDPSFEELRDRSMRPFPGVHM